MVPARLSRTYGKNLHSSDRTKEDHLKTAILYIRAILTEE
jgi:hypothetical protein